MRMLVYLRAVCITAWMSLSLYFTLSHGKFLHTLESPLSAILNRRSSKESHHHRSSKLYSICCTVYALWFRTHRTRHKTKAEIFQRSIDFCVLSFFLLMAPNKRHTACIVPLMSLLGTFLWVVDTLFTSFTGTWMVKYLYMFHYILFPLPRNAELSAANNNNNFINTDEFTGKVEDYFS